MKQEIIHYENNEKIRAACSNLIKVINSERAVNERGPVSAGEGLDLYEMAIALFKR